MSEAEALQVNIFYHNKKIFMRELGE